MRIVEFVIGVGVALFVFAGISAKADIITYGVTGADGSQTVMGSAQFTLSGNQLTLAITNNTSASNTQSTADLLTAVEFNLSGLSLTGGSASGQTVDVNSNLTLTTPSMSETLNSGWGGGNQSGNPDGWVAAAGLNIGSGHAFDGTNLDGADYAIIPEISAVANKDGFGGPYTYGTVTINFGVTGTGTLADDLSNVTFLWGTKPDATLASTTESITSSTIPEPTTLGLLAAGALLLSRRRI